MSPTNATTAALLGAAVGLAAGQPAGAQEAGGESLEEIVVVGSRTRETTALESPVAIDVFAADELVSTGAVNGELGEAIARLAPSFNFPRQSNSGTSDLIRAGQLRGLSPDQILVLVNGRRRHTSAVVNTETKIGRGTAAVDFNALPLNAVKRVEVLRDGAAALYGSDAIAGVVNVVLDDTPGFSSSLTYGAHLTDVDPIGENLTDGQTLTVDAKYGWQLDDGFLNIGAALRTRNGTNRAGFDQVPFFVDQTPDNLALAGQRNYAEGDPEVDELNLWFNGERRLDAVTIYAFATLADRESSGGGAFFRYPDSSSNVRAIFDEGFRPETRADDRDFALNGGLRTEFGGWDTDFSVGYGRNRFEFGVDNSLNASLGPASPTSFDSGEFTNELLALNVSARRDFLAGRAAGPLTVSIGAEYRDETYETEAGDPESYIAGDFDGDIGAQAAPGLTPDDVVDLGRDVVSVFVDGGIDLTDRWFVDAAARFEDYSDFGSALTGKLATRFVLTEAVAIRAAVSNSFRAPNLAQSGFSDTTLNFGANRELIRTRTVRAGDPIAALLGAEALEEESSVNLSAGIVARFERLTLSVDAFRITVDDRVTLSERLFSAPLVAAISALPSGADVESVRFFTNAVDTETTGFDLAAGYELPLGPGSLDLNLAFNLSRTDVESIRATTPELAAIDPTLTLIGVEELNTLEDAFPETKFVLSGDWSTQRFSILGRVSRFGSATRVFNFGGGFEPEQTYGAELQLDLEVGYRPNDHWSFALGAVNALDEYPDLSSADINFFGNLPYDILSPVGVNGRYVYGRLSYRL